MTELIVYPDAHPEGATVDGFVEHIIAGGLSWSSLRTAVGTAANDSLGGEMIEFLGIACDENENKYNRLRRSIFLFNVSALPGGAYINSATFSLYGRNTGASSFEPKVNVYSSAPASNTELVPGDFDSLGSVPFCNTPISADDWTTLEYNDFILNVAGLAALATAIAGAGILKLGVRDSVYDVGGATPPWSYPGGRYFHTQYADYAAGSKPKLTITYNLPVVTTNPATAIRAESAVLNGTLDDDGGMATDCGFEWGETEAYEHGATATQSRTTGQTFSQAIEGLLIDTTYHFRAIATNINGTGYGANRTFTTFSAQGSVDKTIIGNKVSLEALRNLEIVYGGRFYIGKTGNAVYESRYHRNV